MTLPLRVWAGNKSMQGRWQEQSGDDLLALSKWLFGILRNETSNPHNARRVLRHVLNHIDAKYPEGVIAPPPEIYVRETNSARLD
jgi:hypothetical protein